jgi:hypothetical protein
LAKAVANAAFGGGWQNGNMGHSNALTRPPPVVLFNKPGLLLAAVFYYLPLCLLFFAVENLVGKQA